MEERTIKGFDPAPPGKLKLTKALLDSDFDGCVCGALLLNVYPNLELKFTDPASVQAGKFSDFVDKETVVADLVFVPGCGLWFDHHLSNIPEGSLFPGRCGNTPSAAELIYEYYKDVTDLSHFAQIIPELGKFDSATLSIEEVKNTNEYVKIGFAIDRKEIEFNEHFTRTLAKHTWEELMQDPRVLEKLAAAKVQQEKFLEHIKSHTTVIENVAFINNLEFAGQVPHSFFVYSLYPEVEGVVMYSHYTDKTKFSLYRNNFKQNSKKINFLSIAKVMNPASSGGHIGGCGFTLLPQMSVEQAISIIATLLRNF